MKQQAQRIVSLVPSLTELLFDLGLEHEIKGITRFCIHPADGVKDKIKIGGTKDLKMNLIHSIAPDLIVANKEENVKEQVVELQAHYPCHISEIATIKDALETIEDLGVSTGKREQARSLRRAIQAEFDKWQKPEQMLRVAYLIWHKPMMTINQDTFIHHMLQAAGFENVFAHLPARYPMIEQEDLIQAAPDFIFLSSEPYPFKAKHQQEYSALFPHAQSALVDGEIFSWYGSRMLKAPAYFAQVWSELGM